MGELIRLDERRALRRRRREGRTRPRTRAEFFFDLGCPFTYLAAERVDRAFDEVVWTPAFDGALGADPAATAALQRVAEERAEELRMPLVWPERFPLGADAAMRVAACAAAAGRGDSFVLAASRLAFCGGFDLDDPEILAEAAAAAGLALQDCLEAARNVGHDGAIELAGRRLLAAGADRLPALRVGRALYWGERRVTDAIAAARVARVAHV